MGLSTLITALLCEGLVRFVDGNATPMIRLFQENERGEIGLMPNGFARIAAPVGEPWEIHTNADGNRKSSASLSPSAWIAVGDSQVMGNGVADDDPFPAQIRLAGEAVHNLGVPGFGVGDSLWTATRHIDSHPTQGVIVVINQMNDWEEVHAPVGDRYKVRGGWLLKTKDADGPRGSFLNSVLSRSHLCFLVGHLLLRDWSEPAPTPPTWMTDPASERENTLRIAQAVAQFAASHPTIQVVPVYLPADVYATADRAQKSPLTPFVDGLSTKPWEDRRLAEQVLTTLSALDPIDLTPALNAGHHFLEGDYHLSASGHKAVAEAIMMALDSAPKTPVID
jgi:hypothetical protein